MVSATELSIIDHTPKDFALEKMSLRKRATKVIGRVLYSPYTYLRDIELEKKFGFKQFLGLNKVFWGQRGNAYEFHRRRVHKYLPLQSTKLLIPGCGTGQDIESWLKFKPYTLIGIDYFRYDRAWNLRKHVLSTRYDTEINFLQGDLTHLDAVEDRSFDLVGSDAVFEHLNNFAAALSEMFRILKVGGVLYATFGPLWFCWGGDHLSGSDNLSNGYNHLRLTEKQYQEYLDRFGPFSHSEHDGRTWIKHKLFSHLKPGEYLTLMEHVGFKKEYTAAIIEPRALKFAQQFPAQFETLKKDYGFPNLVISGLTFIYRK